MLAVTATLNRGSTRAGPATEKVVTFSRLEPAAAARCDAAAHLQHQAPMSVGMDTRSISMETISDRFCALASPSADACAPDGARRGASRDEPEQWVQWEKAGEMAVKMAGGSEYAPSSSPGGGPQVTHSSSSSATGGGMETLTAPADAEFFIERDVKPTGKVGQSHSS